MLTRLYGALTKSTPAELEHWLDQKPAERRALVKAMVKQIEADGGADLMTALVIAVRIMEAPGGAALKRSLERG